MWGGPGAEERQIGTLDAKLKEVLTLKVMQVSAPCLHDFNSGNLLNFAPILPPMAQLSLHQNRDLEAKKY